ncbi:CARDB domain repeat protein [Geotalea daltonii FRC-32]|uniref:CARDB domain repeat protein n=1 Tax=Geotalea daltonii (strain DSM 22248 / JCM 15807 / FRC-32) TaxID=316067 RepID=B9M745_GEODF|nr:CARDB domain-containing protein [Geotalea daltonii]ACM22066.1 CARDB domain repeat protein [Geotalea daltonii FRC-32]
MDCLKKLDRVMRQTITAVMFMGLVVGIAGISVTAQASTITPVKWDNKEDWEKATRLNIDTTTSPGDVMIGVTKDFVTSATITCVTLNNKIYTTGVDRTSIAVIDARSNTLMPNISLPGRAAGVVYNSQSNKLYVGQYNDNKVLVIDVTTDTITHTLTVGNGAYAAVYNPKSNKAYIANTADQTVTILDGVSDSALITVPVAAGATTASFNAVDNKVYLTSKSNQYMTVIDGVTDQVIKDVEIDPPLNLLGGQAPGNIGLRVDAPVMGINNANAIHLSWNYATPGANQKIQFQIRTAPDVLSLDGATYKGPDGSADTWYDVSTSGSETTTETDGSVTTSVPLNVSFTPAAEIQVKLSSDGLSTPVLHSVMLGYESYADLAITRVTGPATGTIESTIDISYEVKNQGAGAADSSKVGFYLTRDGVDYPLGERTVPSLGPGMSDSTSTTVTIPSIQTGEYYIKACADYTNLVPETDENNNCTTGNVIRISSIEPDLVVTGVTATASGGKLSYSVTIKNQGIKTAGANSIGIYLSTDQLITKEDTLNSAYYYPSGIPGGSSVTLTSWSYIPINMTGTYYVGAIVDNDNIVPESAENNNSRAGNQVTITNDLVVVAGSVSGSVANGMLTCSLKVQNLGNGNASVNYAGIYLSQDEVITNGADTWVAMAYYNGAIRGGDIVTITGSNYLPPNMTGTYYVGAIADYDNRIPEWNPPVDAESNNSRVGNQVTITNDLVVVADSVSGSVANGMLTCSLKVQNLGNGNASVNYAGIYLSQDEVITNGADTWVAMAYYNGAIRGGDIVTITGSNYLPPNMTGTYYVGAIADYDNRIPEWNPPVDAESNNSRVGNQVTITNDLVVVADSVSGSVANGMLTCSLKVQNLGNGNASVNYAGIYLSQDEVITNGADTWVAMAYYNGAIRGGDIVTITGSNYLPPNMTGTYYVGAIADYDNRIPEWNPPVDAESNNSRVGNAIIL